MGRHTCPNFIPRRPFAEGRVPRWLARMVRRVIRRTNGAHAALHDIVYVVRKSIADTLRTSPPSVSVIMRKAQGMDLMSLTFEQVEYMMSLVSVAWLIEEGDRAYLEEYAQDIINDHRLNKDYDRFMRDNWDVLDRSSYGRMLDESAMLIYASNDVLGPLGLRVKAKNRTRSTKNVIDA
jgi:hypothetical protein